ncbi:uncharacterized protein TNCV_2710231 [Trichonephila clavipes]|nr:uncharacterized protein TNCV_2710231 [Trichonephila clavipes]
MSLREESFTRKLQHLPEESSRYGLTWEQDILVLKLSPWLHNENEVDDWISLDKWRNWFKSPVRDSNRSQDIVSLNKFKTIKNSGRNSPMSMNL